LNAGSVKVGLHPANSGDGLTAGCSILPTVILNISFGRNRLLVGRRNTLLFAPLPSRNRAYQSFDRYPSFQMVINEICFLTLQKNLEQKTYLEKALSKG